MTTHIWLLSDGEPDGADGLEGYLQVRLADPHLLRAPGWLRWLVVWWAMWTQQRRLAPLWRQLPGPSPVLEGLSAQAALLRRHLGPRYTCTPVFRYRSPDVAQAAAGIGRGDRVVLLPMLPHRCGVVYSAVALASRELRRREAQAATIPSYPTHARYIEALAETVRAALADLPSEHQTTYEVLFAARLPPECGKGPPPPEHVAELDETVAAVVAAVGLVRPHRLGFLPGSSGGTVRPRGAGTATQLQDAIRRRVPAVVVVPLSFTSEQLGTLVELDQTLGQQARDAGMCFVRAETVAVRPTFVRALGELVRQAEQDAWRPGD